MPPSYFPLRWESTGDQWWYASPIDWAAANGLYDVVRELLHLDPNLLIKLTSLRRIRRLETVWDDDAQFHDVAICRSAVANKLLLAAEMNNGQNSLIRAGYGGWLLYTAASAGDLAFVTDLLHRDPLLVFGEGEFGVSDIFYAAARSKNSDVFKLLFHFGISPTCCFSAGGESDEQSRESEMRSTFRWEMINRAVHASARGGNLEILKELLGDDSDILIYRDAQGSTVLHTAAGRGQVEVVRDLVQSFDIISSTDSQGNTALHVAAYRGYLAVVEVLIQASPSLKGLTNNYGDSFLHMAVAGFVAPGFRRLDKQLELIKQLIGGELLDIEDIINVRNNEGRTVLHTAVSENFQSDLVELLMSVVWIELNVPDADGMTPLDLLKHRPRSASSEVLIKQMILAGGVANRGNCVARNGFVTQLKMHGVGSSPGSCFRISDAEIFLYAGIDGISDGSNHGSSGELGECSSEIRDLDSANSAGKKKLGSVNYAARRLRFLLGEARKNVQKLGSRDSGDDDMEMFHASGRASLRQRYSNVGGNNNKRVFSFTRSSPSPSTKEKFRAGLAQGVIQTVAHLATPSSHRSRSSPTRTEDQKWVQMGRDGGCSSNAKAGPHATYKTGSLNGKLVNKYLCFGTQGVAVKDSISCKRLTAF